MFLLARQAVMIYSPDRRQSWGARAGELLCAPDWVAGTKQFRRMAADGLLVVSDGGTDGAAARAEEKAPAPVRRRKPAESSAE